ncbi:hypothetical protein [Enterobacter kobei]|uniref:hypothetical protein n=1 Tax=Enterobacter kobei TaxID=208224 RepID=UPI001EE15130|nr:hypothetical protein [Enterobacter kobei]
MMTDKDLTDDVLDEIIAGAKTSMEQYLALSLKAERAANRQQNAQQNIPENIPTLRDGLAVIRSLGEIDAAKIQAERDSHNSPVIPDCSCRTCRPVTFSDSRFVVCPECGNKRCPHANDHRNACTGSNEPGQEGSAYPAAPQQEVESQIRKGKTVAMEEWELGARLTKHRFKP